jgi:hypothetical protein
MSTRVGEEDTPDGPDGHTSTAANHVKGRLHVAEQHYIDVVP